MKLKLFSFILVLKTMFINSQTIIQGVVKNEENKNLSYCAIGIKDTKKEDMEHFKFLMMK